MPSEYRKFITIDGKRTCEYDYSQLNPHVAYFMRGREVGSEDAYSRVFDGEHSRDITKLFFLLSLNASDEQALFKAFRSELNYKAYPYTFPDEVLAELLDTIKQGHPDIAHLICSGAGLKLMNIDSRICEYVIAEFVRTNTPILTVHDSFIVPFGQEDRLLQLMREAFEHVTYRTGIKAKFNANLTKKQLYANGAQDRNRFLDMVSFINKGSPSQGYVKRLERHQTHFDNP